MDVDSLLREARAELELAQIKFESLRKIVDGLDGLQKSVPTIEPNVQTSGSEPVTIRVFPKPKDAVSEVMSTRPNQSMPAKAVMGLVQELGLFDPSLKSGVNSYSTALRRLSNDPKSPITQDRFGNYIFGDGTGPNEADPLSGVTSP